MPTSIVTFEKLFVIPCNVHYHAVSIVSKLRQVLQGLCSISLYICNHVNLNIRNIDRQQRITMCHYHSMRRIKGSAPAMKILAFKKYKQESKSKKFFTLFYI